MQPLEQTFGLNHPGIYKITNLVTQKIYVGSAVNVRKRWNLHLLHLRRGSHRNRKLQASFTKHGEAFFCLSVLEICEIPMLVDREQYWMDELSVVATGYNLSPTAGSTLGHKRQFKRLTLEHRQKIGASKVGKSRAPFSNEWRAKLKDAARKPRPKQSEKIRAAWDRRGRKRTVLLCKCGFSRSIVPSARSEYADVYQCRPCYLSSRRVA